MRQQQWLWAFCDQFYIVQDSMDSRTFAVCSAHGALDRESMAFQCEEMTVMCAKAYVLDLCIRLMCATRRPSSTCTGNFPKRTMRGLDEMPRLDRTSDKRRRAQHGYKDRLVQDLLAVTVSFHSLLDKC